MNRKEAEERAVHLVDQMTVEEMASQKIEIKKIISAEFIFR